MLTLMKRAYTQGRRLHVNLDRRMLARLSGVISRTGLLARVVVISVSGYGVTSVMRRFDTKARRLSAQAIRG
jgi:hypothetical protein